MKTNRNGVINLPKVKCPIPGCNTEAKWNPQFFTHFIGAHVKGQKDLNSIIESIKEESEEEHERSKQQSDNDLERFDQKKKNELIERINNFEPQEENEKLITNGVNGERKQLVKYDLKKFIGNNCREERQYALYLAYALEKQSDNLKKIVKQKKDKYDFLKNHEIEEVFYEATLMRDHWYQDRERFNKALWEYVKAKPDKNEKKWPINKDKMQNIKNHANYWPESYAHPLARWMMNAKPDIAVISCNNYEDYYLSFIECKYSSRQDTYRYSDHNIIYELPQLKVQQHILRFLCSLKHQENNNSKLVYGEKELKEGEVLLVQFKGESERQKNIEIGYDTEDLKEFCLDIRELIELYD